MQGASRISPWLSAVKGPPGYELLINKLKKHQCGVSDIQVPSLHSSYPSDKYLRSVFSEAHFFMFFTLRREGVQKELVRFSHFVKFHRKNVSTFTFHTFLSFGRVDGRRSGCWWKPVRIARVVLTWARLGVRTTTLTAVHRSRTGIWLLKIYKRWNYEHFVKEKKKMNRLYPTRPKISSMDS